MLTVHHLRKSQSERIVWLSQELGLAYDLKIYDRDPETMLVPWEYKVLHPIGAAPVITDGAVVLAESEAIVEYIIARQGSGRLAVNAGAENFSDYLYWFCFTNGTLQPSISREMLLTWSGIEDGHPVAAAMAERTARALALLESRLGDVSYLAGEELTAADIMIVFSLTTMRYFRPYDLSPYPNILAFLQRIAARPAYQAAMAKGDPGMALLLD